MVVSTIPIAVAVTESVTITKTISMAVSKTVGVSDRRWNRVSVVAVRHRRRYVRCSVCDLCDGRCIRQFGDRCNVLSDRWSNCDLKIIIFYLLRCFISLSTE